MVDETKGEVKVTYCEKCQKGEPCEIADKDQCQSDMAQAEEKSNSYELADFRQAEENSAPNQRIDFYELKEDGTFKNGTTLEEMLRVSIERLQDLNGRFPCRENSIALTKMQEALHWLNHRTADRIARGVEGKHIA